MSSRMPSPIATATAHTYINTNIHTRRYHSHSQCHSRAHATQPAGVFKLTCLPVLQSLGPFQRSRTSLRFPASKSKRPSQTSRRRVSDTPSTPRCASPRRVADTNTRRLAGDACMREVCPRHCCGPLQSALALTPPSPQRLPHDLGGATACSTCAAASRARAAARSESVPPHASPATIHGSAASRACAAARSESVPPQSPDHCRDAATAASLWRLCS